MNIEARTFLDRDPNNGVVTKLDKSLSAKWLPRLTLKMATNTNYETLYAYIVRP